VADDDDILAVMPISGFSQRLVFYGRSNPIRLGEPKVYQQFDPLLSAIARLR
jgi:hypothetical protein